MESLVNYGSDEDAEVAENVAGRRSSNSQSDKMKRNSRRKRSESNSTGNSEELDVYPNSRSQNRDERNQYTHKEYHKSQKVAQFDDEANFEKHVRHREREHKEKQRSDRDRERKHRDRREKDDRSYHNTKSHYSRDYKNGRESAKSKLDRRHEYKNEDNRFEYNDNSSYNNKNNRYGGNDRHKWHKEDNSRSRGKPETYSRCRGEEPSGTAAASHSYSERRRRPSPEHQESNKIRTKLRETEKPTEVCTTSSGPHEANLPAPSISEGSTVTLDAKAPKKEEEVSIQLPKYYNPSVIHSNKYIEQIQKRKLLWSGKKGEENASKWGTAQFSQDSDGKVASKFMRLMGIKNAETTAVAAAEKSINPKVEGDVKSREAMFSSMEQQYEVARQATHTMRGVGLGFSSQARPF